MSSKDTSELLLAMPLKASALSQSFIQWVLTTLCLCNGMNRSVGTQVNSAVSLQAVHYPLNNCPWCLSQRVPAAQQQQGNTWCSAQLKGNVLLVCTMSRCCFSQTTLFASTCLLRIKAVSTQWCLRDCLTVFMPSCCQQGELQADCLQVARPMCLVDNISQ